MSRIFVIKKDNNELKALKVFPEGNDSIAYKFAKNKSGSSNPDMDIKAFRDSNKIFQLVIFNKSVACISSSKMLNLNKNDLKESLSENLPEEALEYLNSTLGVNSKNKASSKEETVVTDDKDKKQEAYNPLRFLTF